MTIEELQAELAKVKNENAKLKAAKNPALTCKVSEEKKALSVYGLGRFPVTLYKEQWNRLLEFAPGIREFMKKHDAELAVKAS